MQHAENMTGFLALKPLSDVEASSNPPEPSTTTHDTVQGHAVTNTLLSVHADFCLRFILYSLHSKLMPRQRVTLMHALDSSSRSGCNQVAILTSYCKDGHIPW
jgi:hypothetical protein